MCETGRAHFRELAVHLINPSAQRFDRVPEDYLSNPCKDRRRLSFQVFYDWLSTEPALSLHLESNARFGTPENTVHTLSLFVDFGSLRYKASPRCKH